MSIETGPLVLFGWRPNGRYVEVLDGDQYLVALQVRDSQSPDRTWLECAVVTIRDGEPTLDGDPWGWEWKDVEWYVPIEELSPIVFEKGVNRDRD